MLEKYEEQIFNDGVDESAEELVATGGIDKLVNGVFRREGGITKRNGFSLLSSPTTGTLAKDAAHTLAANGGALVALRKLDTMPFAASVTGSPGVNDNLFAQKSFVAAGHVESVGQLRDGRGYRNASVSVGTVNGKSVMTVCGQALVSTVNESSDEFQVAITEPDTGARVAGTVLTGRRPRPVWRGTKCLVLYQFLSSGSWRPAVVVWDGSTFSAPVFLDGGTGTVVSDISVSPIDDGIGTFIAWIETAGGFDIAFIKRLDASGAIVSGTFISVNSGDTLIDISHGKQHPSLLWVLYGQPTVADVKLTALLATLPASPTLATATTVLTNAGSAAWRNIHIRDLGTSGTQLVACGTWMSTGSAMPDTVYSSVDYTQGVSVPSAIVVDATQALGNTILHAEPMLVYPDDTQGDTNSTPMLLLARYSDTPASASARTSTPTSFALALPVGSNFNATELGSSPYLAATVIADGAYQGAGSNLVYTFHAPSPVWQDGVYYYVAQLELEEAPAAGSFVYGIRVLRFRFSTQTATNRPLPRAVLGGLTYLGGNQLRCFDGVSVGEAVPLLPPPAPALAQTTGGFLDLLATYSYSCVAVWEDAQGLVHRSAPSPAVSVTLTSTNSKVTLTWDAKQLYPSALNYRTLGWRYPRLEVYRTEGDGSVYYLEQTVNYPELSAATLNSTLPDSVITANKLLYTTGAVLANKHPPPVRALTAVGQRLFGIDAVNPRSIVFSKEASEGYAAEFAPELSLRLEASESEPVALAGMGDLLVMFTEREAWAISTHGGPDALGAGTFGLPERLATDCGASSPEAAVSTPLGVLVHGPSGFRMLTPQGAVDVPTVSDSAPGTSLVRRAMYVPEREEVWFLMTDGTASNRIVVFSYARNRVRWSTWELQYSGSLPDIRDMVNADGTQYLLVRTAAGTYKVMRYDTSTYLDQGAYFIPTSVRLRWFKPEGQMGDTRFRRVHVFGTGGVGGLQAKVYVDDVDGSPDDDISVDPFHSDTFSWTSTQLAEDGRQVHVRGRLKRQKGAAARVQLDFVAPVSGSLDVKGPVLHAVGWDFALRGQSAQRGPTFEG